MTLEELKDELCTTQLPVAYRFFAAPQQPPFICYMVTEAEPVYADDAVYVSFPKVRVELYTDKKDPQAEATVEIALKPFCWAKTETYIDSEKMYLITYEFEV